MRCLYTPFTDLQKCLHAVSCFMHHSFILNVVTCPCDMRQDTYICIHVPATMVPSLALPCLHPITGPTGCNMGSSLHPSLPGKVEQERWWPRPSQHCLTYRCGGCGRPALPPAALWFLFFHCMLITLLSNYQVTGAGSRSSMGENAVLSSCLQQRILYC